MSYHTLLTDGDIDRMMYDMKRRLPVGFNPAAFSSTRLK